MTDPHFYEVIDATWPAARFTSHAGWLLRDGQGGGKRVSATTALDPAMPGEIDAAEAVMHTMGQSPLFIVRDGEDQLDAALATRGYALVDPVIIYACPVDHLTNIPLPRVTAFEVWEPLAIMLEIWASGGIGHPRIAVMERARGPKTGILARFRDKPAGVAYAAIHDGTAMAHAIEVLPHQRGQGVGSWIMRAIAFWAKAQGAQSLALMCTRENASANALYTSLGMNVVGQYHYRQLPTEKT